MRKTADKILFAFMLLTSSSAAFAHPGHDVSGFAAGLMHPFSGMDHLLAMVAVGLWAAQGSTGKNGRRKVWLLPATFMAMLVVGAGIAMRWQSLPLVEAGIATSVLSLGLLIMLSLQLPVAFSMSVTALFGLFHGYAHGLELPQSAAPAEFALGFLAATASLHLCGIATGLAIRKHDAFLTRLAGGAIAVCGVYLLASA
ncbi:MAG: HupE/UreJ family protein [Gallionella sp.]